MENPGQPLVHPKFKDRLTELINTTHKADTVLRKQNKKSDDIYEIYRAIGELSLSLTALRTEVESAPSRHHIPRLESLCMNHGLFDQCNESLEFLAKHRLGGSVFTKLFRGRNSKSGTQLPKGTEDALILLRNTQVLVSQAIQGSPKPKQSLHAPAAPVAALEQATHQAHSSSNKTHETRQSQGNNVETILSPLATVSVTPLPKPKTDLKVLDETIPQQTVVAAQSRSIYTTTAYLGVTSTRGKVCGRCLGVREAEIYSPERCRCDD